MTFTKDPNSTSTILGCEGWPLVEGKGNVLEGTLTGYNENYEITLHSYDNKNKIFSEQVRFNIRTGTEMDDHSNSRADATVIALGSSKHGKIEKAGDVDYFKFTTNRAGMYKIYTTGSMDTKGVLEDSTGIQLANNDDGGASTNFSISHQLKGNTTYYVKVAGYDTKTGSYTLHVEKSAGVIDDYGNSRSNATVIALGSSKHGKIEVGGDVDYFKFTTNRAGEYKIYTTGSTDVKGALENNSGTELASNDDGGEGRNFSISHNLSANTTYYVKVQGYSDSKTGSYILHVDEIAGMGDGDLTPEQTHLYYLGYLTDKNQITGDYNEATIKAVKAYQEVVGIEPVSGFIGPTEWDRLASSARAKYEKQIQERGFLSTRVTNLPAVKGHSLEEEDLSKKYNNISFLAGMDYKPGFKYEMVGAGVALNVNYGSIATSAMAILYSKSKMNMDHLAMNDKNEQEKSDTWEWNKPFIYTAAGGTIAATDIKKFCTNTVKNLELERLKHWGAIKDYKFRKTDKMFSYGGTIVVILKKIGYNFDPRDLNGAGTAVGGAYGGFAANMASGMDGNVVVLNVGLSTEVIDVDVAHTITTLHSKSITDPQFSSYQDLPIGAGMIGIDLYSLRDSLRGK